MVQIATDSIKLGVISDLHIDNNEKGLALGDSFESILSDVMTERKVDLLLISGDISNDYKKSQLFIEDVQQRSGIPIAFVPGNHDFWQKDAEPGSARAIYDYFEQQPESLINSPKLLNDKWAVVGNPGWYDYGYGDKERYDEAEFERRRYRFADWNDKHYVDWGASDREVSQWMKGQLISDLEQVADRKIILMTHIATHPQFVVPLPHKLYDYMNAFLGAADYEELYKEYAVRYNVMGHVHFRHRYVENDTEHLMACLGNRKHWMNKTDARTEIENTFISFIVND